MVINGETLLDLAPLEPMFDKKIHHQGVSHGLAEVGYDIRIKQDVWFYGRPGSGACGHVNGKAFPGRFTIASAMEEFSMPADLMGIVHDKSTWARRGLSVFNTVIEPGWKGFLTLELVYHGAKELLIPAGSGIAQVVFHRVMNPARYVGKYQNQADRPVEAIQS